MDALKAAIKREGVQEEVILDQKLDPELLSFDHNRCTDCAYSYAMACDCMSHLTALQKQVHDANKRLQSLVEIRERMREAYETVVAVQEAQPSNEKPEKNQDKI
jgi:PHP family Zn ribbon phosphoesterase